MIDGEIESTVARVNRTTVIMQDFSVAPPQRYAVVLPAGKTNVSGAIDNATKGKGGGSCLVGIETESTGMPPPNILNEYTLLASTIDGNGTHDTFLVDEGYQLDTYRAGGRDGEIYLITILGDNGDSVNVTTFDAADDGSDTVPELLTTSSLLCVQTNWSKDNVRIRQAQQSSSHVLVHPSPIPAITYSLNRTLIAIF